MAEGGSYRSLYLQAGDGGFLWIGLLEAFGSCRLVSDLLNIRRGEYLAGPTSEDTACNTTEPLKSFFKSSPHLVGRLSSGGRAVVL